MKKSKLLLVLVAVLATSSPAFAAEGGLDVTAAVAILGTITAAVASIGAAKLAPAATSVAFKWAKGALFS